MSNNYEIEFKAITNPAEILYKPDFAIAYEGISYPNTESQFTTVLSDSLNADIGINPATVRLHSLANFCYTKLVTNDDYSNFYRGAININNQDSNSQPFIAGVEWSDLLTACGVENELNVETNYYSGYGGGDIEPPLQYHTVPTYLGSLYIDKLSLPLVPRVGDSIMYSYVNNLNSFQQCLSADETINPLIPSPFYNGEYTINDNGTFTFRTLLRYYEDGNGSMALALVPPSNNDTVSELPPLYLYILESLSGTPVTIYYPSIEGHAYFDVNLFVPVISYDNSFVDNDTYPYPIIVHYTTDGSTPTTSSDSVVFNDYARRFGLITTLSLSLDPGSSFTLKAFATRSGWKNSEIVSVVFKTANNSLDISPILTAHFDGQDYDVTSQDLKFLTRDGNQQYESMTFTLSDYETEGGVTTAYYAIGSENWNEYTDGFQLRQGLYGYSEIKFKFLKEGCEDYFTSLCSLELISWTNPSFSAENYYEWSIQSTGDQTDNVATLTNVDLAYGISGPLWFYADDSDGFVVLVDDWRYVEFEIQRITTNEAKIEFKIADNTFRQDGLLIYPDGFTVVDTGLTWGEGDILRVRYNYYTAGFYLAVNDSEWHDETENPITLDELSSPHRYRNWTFVVDNFKGTISPYGTTIRFISKASNFIYEIPANTSALGLTNHD